MAQVIKIKRNNIEKGYKPNIINSVLIIYIDIKVISEPLYHFFIISNISLYFIPFIIFIMNC